MTARAATERGLAWLTRAEAAVAVTALCLSAAALIADIFTREVLGFGLFGALRVAVYATAVAAFLGFCVCIASGGHLRVSLLDRAVPLAFEPVLVRLGHLVSAAISLFFAGWAYYYVRETFRYGETDPSLGLAVWTVQAVMPWMFASAALRYLAYAAFPDLAPAERTAAA